jgi:dsRNA-specific ribonuclease
MDNKENVMITKEEVEKILNFYTDSKLHIRNLEYYQRAFVHESYYQNVQNEIINNSIKYIHNFYIPIESNERLEFLGDHILKSVIGKYLFYRYPNEREGFLTKIKIKIEKASTLYNFAKKLNFKKYLLLSSQVESQTFINYNRGRNTPSFYEDAFEAFIGSIILDFGDEGYNIAEKFIINIIESFVDFSELIYNNDNFKDSIQRFFQNKKIPVPVYKHLNTHDKNFLKIVLVNNKYIQDLNIDVDKIKKKSFDILESYKLKKEEYDEIFKILQDNFIIGFGYDKKVINAEQKCAKDCLLNLGLSLKY